MPLAFIPARSARVAHLRVSGRELAPLAEGFAFLEGPRWHDGRLWFSDMHGHRVMTVDLAGHTEVVAALRRDVGVYCMTYVRSIMPPETEPMWIRLNQTIAQRKSAGAASLWNSLEGKLGQERVD